MQLSKSISGGIVALAALLAVAVGASAADQPATTNKAPIPAPAAPATNNPVTAPSAATPPSRSVACAKEADRRGLKDAPRHAFALACQATAGPVEGVGAGTKKPAPAAAKPDLGVVKDGKQH